MNYLDAHAHVWTDDIIHYPLAAGPRKEAMKPVSFTPTELFKHGWPNGVERFNLIQMRFHGFNNDYLLHMATLHKERCVATAVIDPTGRAVERLMTDLGKQRVRAFRIYPGLERGI